MEAHNFFYYKFWLLLYLLLLLAINAFYVYAWLIW
jgi:hypothetical protein